MKPSQLALVAASALSGTHAHSHITNMIVNGESYQGFSTKVPAGTNPAVLAAWSTTVGPSDGWIGHKAYRTPDIVCHVNASNAQGFAPLDAGDRVHFQWQGWPESHKGPALTALAWCGGDGTAAACAEADKTELEFFQIGAAGLMDPDGVPNENPTASGLWASDMLIANNNSWAIEIPADVAPGFYVLRHELIALHYANDEAMGGTQHYPQCMTVEIRGEGTERPAGTRAMDMYSAEDPGLTYDIFREELTKYPVPGPKMMEGVPALVRQTVGEVLDNVPAVPAYDKRRC
jgi:cellulase